MNSQVERLLQSAAPGIGYNGYHGAWIICKDMGLNPETFLTHPLSRHRSQECECRGQDDIPCEDWSNETLVVASGNEDAADMFARQKDLVQGLPTPVPVLIPEFPL